MRFARADDVVAGFVPELDALHELYPKPLILSEFGADTIPGWHAQPPEMFSEEYQCELFKRYQAAFDSLDFLVGEHVWTFSDFMTPQGVLRAHGNRKGVFTRDRRPKMAAHQLRERWTTPGAGDRPKRG